MNDAQANVSSSNCKCLNYFHDKAIYAFKRDTKDSLRSLHVYVLRLGTITERKVQMYNDNDDMSLNYKFIFILYTGSFIVIC